MGEKELELRGAVSSRKESTAGRRHEPCVDGDDAEADAANG